MENYGRRREEGKGERKEEEVGIAYPAGKEQSG